MARVETIPELYDTTIWKFKAEGNANITLSYVGENARFSATVLRLRKDNQLDTIIDSCSYVNSVMKPLLGDEYVGESILLEIRPEFLKALSKSILKMRSNNRTQKDIDHNQKYALLMSDHTMFPSNISPTLSVELKYLKQGHITRYCPLDLFSLEDKRIRKAIDALIDCPRNNLKLFIQGMQIKIGKENWPTSLCKFFEVDYSELDDKKQQYVIDMFIALLIQAIKEEQYLFRKLKTLQKTLDELDIEGINKLLITYQPKLSELSLEEWKLIVDEYVKRTATNNSNNENAREFMSTMEYKQIRQRIYEHLMSATLKDCSIIFSFRKSDMRDVARQNSHSSPIFQNKERLQQISLSDNYLDRSYVYKVNVIDLDPKPLAKLPYYQELDAKIVENYLKCNATNNSKCSE
ncbi:inositol-pentakisphosphate 2-kinase-like [Rhizophagus clarus]|uniref:Inositol-pentakisphosphate 2-kinase n=1 Tax=Rhizophagus clarus TaxID=94130 RepID=A0A8H3L0A6_9GLOM|nr:inositol-pentakisphosphate 2-kinase-like [Rhizophagus clarus]